jgi:hypothetical protein
MQFPIEISFRYLHQPVHGSVYVKGSMQEQVCFAVTDIESDLVGQEFRFRKLNEFHLQCIESPEGTEPVLLRTITRKLKQLFLKPKISIESRY